MAIRLFHNWQDSQMKIKCYGYKKQSMQWKYTQCCVYSDTFSSANAHEFKCL